MTETCVMRQCRLTGDEADRYACFRCTEGIRRRIREVETYVTMLRSMLLPRRGDTGRRSPGFGSAPPLNLAVLDALDGRTEHEFDEDSRPILWRLESVCRLVLEERRTNGEDGEGEDYRADLAGMVTYLLWATEWVAYQVWVDDYAANLSEIHSAARSMAGDTPPAPLAPCLAVECGGAPVYWVYGVGRDEARCSNPSCPRKRYVGLDLLRLRVQEAS